MPDRMRRALMTALPVIMLPKLVHAASVATPSAAEGPYYPVALPADHDYDLVRNEAVIRQAGGQILHLTGSLKNTAGNPIEGGLVDIWQCDINGVYLHPGSPGYEGFDRAFQGVGRAMTNETGQFVFRTIVPAPYPGRTPHIHLKASIDGQDILTTQYYLSDHPMNRRDGLFNRMSDAERIRQSLTLRPLLARDATSYQTEIEVVVET